MSFLPFVLLDAESLSRSGIEQMHEPGVGFEPDLIARLELVPFAAYRDDLLFADLGDDLKFRACRLHDLHDRLGAVVGDDKVFGPYAIDRVAAIAAARRRAARQTGRGTRGGSRG